MRFEDLEAWQEARRLTRDVYDLTRNNDLARDFPPLPKNSERQFTTDYTDYHG